MDQQQQPRFTSWFEDALAIFWTCLVNVHAQLGLQRWRSRPILLCKFREVQDAVNAAAKLIRVSSKFKLMKQTTQWMLGTPMSAADLCWHVVNSMLKARVPLDAKQSNALLLPQLRPEPGEVITRRIGGPRGLLHGPNLQGMHPLALRLWRLLQQHSGFTMSPASCLVVEGGVFALCVAEGGWVHAGPSGNGNHGNNQSLTTIIVHMYYY
jgi:hypothetical protein